MDLDIEFDLYELVKVSVLIPGISSLSISKMNYVSKFVVSDF